MNSDKSPTRCHRTWEFICAVTLLCPEAPPPQSYPSSLSITVFLATFLVSSLIPGSWGLRDDKDIHLRLGEEETFLKVWSLALLLFWKCLWLLRVVSFFSLSQSSLYKRIVSVHSLSSHMHTISLPGLARASETGSTWIKAKLLTKNRSLSKKKKKTTQGLQVPVSIPPSYFRVWIPESVASPLGSCCGHTQ